MFDILEINILGIGDGIGHLVDITPDGFMIRSGAPIEVGKTYKIQVNLRDSLPGHENLDLVASCQWCRTAPTLGGYNAGFQMSRVSPETLAAIEALTEPMTSEVG